MVYFVFLLFLATSSLVEGQDASDPLPTSISQSNTSMNQPQEIVGWVGNPRQRGTLTLLIECLTTIFACTWTVLHLNLPAPKDTAITRILRRIKWMAITILFPEFIFAKAVCELRLALHTLYLLSEKMNNNPDAFQSTAKYKSDESDIFKVVWRWEAKNGRMIKWLRKLLVGRQKSSGTDIESAQLGKGIPPACEGRKELLPGMELCSMDAMNPGKHGGRDALLLPPWNVSPDMTGTPAEDPNQGTTGMETQNPEMRLGDEEASAGTRASDGYHNARTLFKTQIWTLSHSYYLNMGGVHRFMGVYEHESGKREPIYSVIRGYYLANLDLQSWQAHPLKDLRLSENEIRDKSKADWIGRTVAILQIGRLGLDVINRAVNDRPVTQIELATVAFAIFAIVTYLINWWKPKDISEPTFLDAVTKENDVSDVVEGSTEPFFIRLLFPVPPARSSASKRDLSQYRIGNDELWMDGRLPLIWPLMTVSCLVFGGFHCIAWSFQFPTWSEKLAWRIASLASMFLPVIALAGTSLIIQSCNGALIRQQIRAAVEVVEALEPLERIPQECFSYFSEGSVSRAWASLTKRELAVLEALENYLKHGDRMRGALSILKACKHGSNMQAEALNASAISRLPLSFTRWWLFDSELGFLFGKKLDDMDFSTNDLRRIIDRFEQMKLAAGTGPEENIAMVNWIPVTNASLSTISRVVEAFSIIRTCMSQYDKCNNEGELYKYELAKRRLADRARILSRPVNIVSGVLYTAARVALLGLMFSSLRAVPKGVYETSDWTRFLPSFS